MSLNYILNDMRPIITKSVEEIRFNKKVIMYKKCNKTLCVEKDLAANGPSSVCHISF